MSILLPLQVAAGNVARAPKLKMAVDAFLDLLLTTACRSCVADPQFGFVFNNLKFEIFNENEGVIYNSAGDGVDSDMYSKKFREPRKALTPLRRN